MTGGNAGSNKEKVLIIDDDAVFARLLSRSLQTRGFDLSTAHNAEDGLAAAIANQPDHVLLDMKLGEESGLDLIPQLCQVLPDVRLIVLTAYASIPTTVEAMRRGAVDYLCKPVDADSVVKALTVKTADLENVESVAGEEAARPLSLRRLEWEHIQRLLQENDGNVSETARQLGMHRRSLQRKLAKRPARN